MRSNNLEKLDLELYEETLKNGLKVFIVPKENVNGIYATLSTKFGSIHTEFTLNDSNKIYSFHVIADPENNRKGFRTEKYLKK